MFTKSTIALATIVGLTSGALAATTQQHSPNPTWEIYIYPTKQQQHRTDPTWDRYDYSKPWQDPSVDIR
jgi:hypothetical protein